MSIVPNVRLAFDDTFFDSLTGSALPPTFVATDCGTAPVVARSAACSMLKAFVLIAGLRISVCVAL